MRNATAGITSSIACAGGAHPSARASTWWSSGSTFPDGAVSYLPFFEATPRELVDFEEAKMCYDAFRRFHGCPTHHLEVRPGPRRHHGWG